MAAAVLNSSRAVELSLYVVRAFIELRAAVTAHKEILKKLDQLENKVGTRDRAIMQILETIRQLAAPLPAQRRKIGFL